MKAYLGNINLREVRLGDKNITKVDFPIIQSQAVLNYINATGISTDQAVIVNNLYNGLNQSGIISKMYAIYPFLGTTSGSQKYNLIDTGSYTIEYNGTWEFTESGSITKGDGFANTSFIPLSQPDWSTNASFGIYNQYGNPGGYDMGTQNAGSAGNQLCLATDFLGEVLFGLPQVLSTRYSPTDGFGFYQVTRNGGVTGGQIDGDLVISQSVSFGAFYPPQFPMYIGAINTPFQSPTVQAYASGSYGIAYIGQGLSEGELDTFNAVVQTYVSQLSRNVPLTSL